MRGHGNAREKIVIRSLRLKPEELERSIEERGKKYEAAEKELVRWEEAGLENAEIVFVAFGSTSRIVKDAMVRLGADGIGCGLIRPVTLWPFPYGAFDKIGKGARVVFSIELSKGQMIQDVKIGVNGRIPVELIYRTGGALMTPEDIVARVKEYLG
jgi:2-oxoglutarate ferredoxin oxidoreductase subunit alpha